MTHVVRDFFRATSKIQHRPRHSTQMATDACACNPPELSASCGAGHVLDDLGGLKAYVAGFPDSKLAVLLVSDVFGFEAPKLRKIADKVASSGYFVVVPDFMHGDPLDPDNPSKPIHVWIQSHLSTVGAEEAKVIIAAMRAKGYSVIGAAGYCWGGKVVSELAKSDIIQAAVLLHPSRVTVEDIADVKCPISILGAEMDQGTPPELVNKFGEILSANSVDHFVKIFPGVAHGWACRYEDSDAAAVQSADEALGDMLQWFDKHLK